MNKIFVYNPTCELAFANASGTYTPPANLAKFEADMASLMLFLADPDDYVLADEPDDELKRMLINAGVKLPKFCTAEEAKSLIDKGFEVAPWNDGPDVWSRVGHAERNVVPRQELRLQRSRLTSVEIEQMLAEMDLPEWMKPTFVPQIIRTEAELDALQNSLPIVLKSLWSSSGRGVVMVRDEKQWEAAKQFAQNRLRKDGAIIAEPLLYRVQDLSMMFDKNQNYIGHNHFEATDDGRFWREKIGLDCSYFRLPENWEAQADEVLTEVTKRWCKKSGYNGYVSFDLMIYSVDTELFVRLCTEVNLRLCMGNVNHEISKFFVPEMAAIWQILSFDNDGEWDDYCREQAEIEPLDVDVFGRIQRGFFRLTPSGRGRRFGACGIAF